MEQLHVLISLHKGYGLGDGCQMSAVLRHVQKYRPHWTVDFQAEAGRACVGRGLTANQFVYGEPYPTPHYDAEVQICLYDRWEAFSDRPNTRVSSCLRNCFDLPWDADCGRYYIEVRLQVRDATRVLVKPQERQKCSGQVRTVGVHYQGDSAADRKNLTHEQAYQICKEVEKLGCAPLLLDWRNTSPIPDAEDIRTTGRIPMSPEWGRDAEYNCGVISQCAAFVGIDSGPAKCASATETPSLVVWTGHHPAPFHDPSPNTTHLVPYGYHSMAPVCGDVGVIEWFNAHYTVRWYGDDLTRKVADWLREVLA